MDILKRIRELLDGADTVETPVEGDLNVVVEPDGDVEVESPSDASVPAGEDIAVQPGEDLTGEVLTVEDVIGVPAMDVLDVVAQDVGIDKDVRISELEATVAALQAQVESYQNAAGPSDGALDPFNLFNDRNTVDADELDAVDDFAARFKS